MCTALDEVVIVPLSEGGVYGSAKCVRVLQCVWLLVMFPISLLMGAYVMRRVVHHCKIK